MKKFSRVGALVASIWFLLCCGITLTEYLCLPRLRPYSPHDAKFKIFYLSEKISGNTIEYPRIGTVEFPPETTRAEIVGALGKWLVEHKEWRSNPTQTNVNENEIKWISEPGASTYYTFKFDWKYP